MKLNTAHYRSAAKINLTLDILGIRPNGYHELSSIIHTVGLFDELSFEFGQPLELECNKPELQGEDNLCLRAAKLYREAAGLSPEACSARIALVKVIPAGAGLGGGSGNAAATLRAFNDHYEALEESKLHQLAARLGADVPLFLDGGCQLMEGVGEILSPLPPLRGWLLIAQPPQHGDTAAVYAAWDALAKETGLRSSASTSRALGKLRTARVNYNSDAFLLEVAAILHNDLLAAAEICGVPACSVVTALRASGSLGACMTGSGSAAFGLFPNEESARQAERKLRVLEAGSKGELVLQHVFIVPLCENAIDCIE